MVNQALQTEPEDFVWGDTLPVLSQADVRIGNLECVLSNIGAPWSITPKTFHFRSDGKNVKALEVANITAVTLANNHAFDFDYEALSDMLDILDEAGIHYAGAGGNFLESSRPAIFETKGEKIGLLAFTDNEPEWESVGPNPGIFYAPIDLEANQAKFLLGLVKETKLKVDTLIVSAHWGGNWGYRPEPGQVDFAHTLVENGADIVFGHSPHIFRGVEIYRHRPIIYSAGNFIDDYAVNELERNDESFVFQIEFGKGRVNRLCLYPAIIKDLSVKLARYNRADEIAGKMSRLSRELSTETKWNEKKECLEIEVI